MSKKPIMIMGCTSDAGKSFVVTCLCRHFANQGISVAPFKAQNMSNNSAVTSQGLEMGRAQYLQALAARIIPQVRMNPILLKPSSDTYAQVITLGKFNSVISKLPWLERKEHLWPIVTQALHSLITDYEQVVIEGAGSPAEINLRQNDIVNMSVALECQADVYLVADIDRGGAFAHLLGTWECLEKNEKALIKGFILNKFRGDPTLLGNASQWLEAKTGVKTVAVIPMSPHILPEEDTFTYRAKPIAGNINLALINYPYASNLDEFDPLIYETSVTVVPIRDTTLLDDFAAIILPGSKNTAASLRHLQDTGLTKDLIQAAKKGVPIFGICGGMQLLGNQILDPQHLESGDIEGLGLLDLTTILMPNKTTQQKTIPWKNGQMLKGYEIHHGQTNAGPKAITYLADELGWQQNKVYGVYLHGLFENTIYRIDFLTSLGWQGETTDWNTKVDLQMNSLAKLIVSMPL